MSLAPPIEHVPDQIGQSLSVHKQGIRAGVPVFVPHFGPDLTRSNVLSPALRVGRYCIGLFEASAADMSLIAVWSSLFRYEVGTHPLP